MKRDKELERKILFKIEAEYEAGQKWLHDLSLEGFEMEVVAEHCDLLYQQGFISDYELMRTHTGPISFKIGNLTAYGYDFLELIRNPKIWKKTVKEVKEKNLPNTWEHIARIAGIFVGNMISEMSD